MEKRGETDRAEMLEQEILSSRGKDRARVLELCRELESVAEKEEDEKRLGFAYYYAGESYYVLNDTEQMFMNIARALGYLNRSGQWELVARAYNLMAIMSVSKGNASVAVDYYLTGLKYCNKYGISNVKSSLELNLGYLYLENGIYREAQGYFENAYQNYVDTPEEQRSIASLTMIYTNLAICYMLRGMFEKTKEYIDRLSKECEPHFEDIDYIYVDCMKARYYYLSGGTSELEACVENIMHRISQDVLILDIFDDVYEFCLVMFEADRDDVVWEIVKHLEEPVENTGIVNLQRKLLSLKMKYYRKNGKTKELLPAAGRYYELMEVIEADSQSMVSNMLYLRSSLEQERENRRQLEVVNAELVKKSESDAMTGLANRYRLSNYSEEIVKECFEQERPLSFEILDIDYFKEYNDNYGHQAGDECIRQIADLLKGMQNEHTFCARYGGDEFIIIYSGLEEGEVAKKAEKLRKDVMDLKIEHLHSKADTVVTISQGICHDIPAYGNRNWDFLHVADTYLYQIKKKMRNQFCMGDIHGREISINTRK